jgi:SAM-dependent methyltransferase
MHGLPTTAVESCPMCGSWRRKPYASKDGGGYARCRNCATVYADPRLADEVVVRRLEEFAPAEGPDRDSPDSFRAAVEAEAWKLELVESLPVAGRRLLDVGTGSGAFPAAAARAGYDAEGHDLAPAVAAAAEKRFGLPVHTGDVADLDGPYHVITMWDTLEHCVSPPGMLRTCARLLAPGGYVVILSPHSAGVSARLLRGRWWVYGPTDHIVMFSTTALGHALAGAGLRPVILRTRQLAPPYPPETADPSRPLMRAHRWVDHHPRVQSTLTRLGLGDWIYAVAGRPAPAVAPCASR